MQPDLTPAERWLAGRSAQERKGLGQWLTPWWVVQHVTERVIADLPMFASVIDPACGDGRWLLAAGRLRPDLQLIGLDIDPDAIAAATETLARAGVRAQLSVGDALAADAPWPQTDLVLGNPPFVRPQNLPRDQRDDLWDRFDTLTDKADLYCCFVERAVSQADRVAFVIPDTWLHMASFAALRVWVQDAGVSGIYSLPTNTFKGARVKSVVLLTGDEAAGAGILTEQGFEQRGRIGFSDHAWSLDGPLPELAGTPLAEHVTIHMGVVCGDYARYVHPGPASHPLDRRTCRGRDVQRWAIDDRDEWLRYDPADMLARKPYVAPKHAGIFDVPAKIILAGTSGTELRAAMDTERRFALDSCYVLGAKTPDVDLHAVLGFLLSEPVSHWYGARHRGARVKGVEVARIPLPEKGWSRVAEAARDRDEDGLERAVVEAYG